MSFKMTQSQYTSLYGPTVGDSVRLGDTNLFAQVEKDYANYGDEATSVVVNLSEMVWLKTLTSLEMIKMLRI